MKDEYEPLDPERFDFKRLAISIFITFVLIFVVTGTYRYSNQSEIGIDDFGEFESFILPRNVENNTLNLSEWNSHYDPENYTIVYYPNQTIILEAGKNYTIIYPEFGKKIKKAWKNIYPTQENLNE